MNKYLSPGNLIVTTGGILAFIGMTAYFTDSVNLSVPTFFYGVPIFLIGLGLKTSEIPPVKLFDKSNFATNRFNRPKELTALVKDVTRWRYGIKAHLESSLEALNLWDEDDPPQLQQIEEITKEDKTGLRLHFEINGVPVEKWIEKQDRLNRFFVKGLESEFDINDNNKEFDFIVGTHAIFQENLVFNQLKYVIIDEQHRFGVRQRLILGEKGINTNILLMSATPIPRTLALAQYGEIEQVVLNEKPAFQRPIITKVSNSKKIKDLIIYLKKSISDKNQIYWICPLVEESENHEYKDVESRFKSLQKVFGSKVGLLHGKMKATDKENTINEFKLGKIGILVATTVVEVGIDNKNANTLVI